MARDTPEQTTNAQLKEAREIFDALHAMGPGLTINDRIVFIANCLAKPMSVERERCVWTPDSDGTYETSCDEAFVFTAGGPAENGARYCCYCGKSLKEIVRAE